MFMNPMPKASHKLLSEPTDYKVDYEVRITEITRLDLVIAVTAAMSIPGIDIIDTTAK